MMKHATTTGGLIAGALAALLLVSCAAGDGTRSREDGANEADAGGPPASTNPFADPCIGVEDASLPEQCEQNGPGDADVDSDADAGTRRPPAQKAQGLNTPKPVRIRKKSGDLGSCIYDEECEPKVIRATGGSERGYVWTMEGGPAGLTLENTGNRDVARIVGRTTELGSFRVSIAVADLDDASNRAQKEYDLVVEDTIAIDLYEYDAAQGAWTRLPRPSGRGDYDGISLAPNTDLRLEVSGHDGDGQHYTWSLDGARVECDDGEGSSGYCEATVGEALTLATASIAGDPAGTGEGAPAEGRSTVRGRTAYLHASSDYLDRNFQNVPITVKDSHGNEITVRIAAMEFERDPCTIPLAIEGWPQGPILTSTNNPEFSFSFTVSGGLPPYQYGLEIPPEVPNREWLDVEIAPSSDGDAHHLALDGAVRAPDGLSLKESAGLGPWNATATVRDSCPTPQIISKPFSVQLNMDTIATAEAGTFHSRITLGANDTDEDSRIFARLTDSYGENLASWGAHPDSVWLDRYGDESERYGHDCDVDGDDTHCRYPVAKRMYVNGGGRTIDISKARWIRFIANDPGSGGWLDVMFYDFRIEAGSWCGQALDMPREHECEGDRCEWDFGITWKTRASDGTCSFEGATKKEIENARQHT